MKKLLAAMLVALLTGCTTAQIHGFEPGNLFAVTQPSNYLTAHDYERLLIEVIPAQGSPVGGVYALQAAAMRFCNKPAGIEVVNHSPIADVAPKEWTNTQLKAFRDRFAEHRTRANTAVLHLLYLPGTYEGDPHVAAVCYDYDAVAIFPDTFQGYGVDTILAHEFGHILGLCNNGTPKQSNHEDSSSSGHCKYQTCVMFWVTSNQNDFCPDCLKDLGRQ